MSIEIKKNVHRSLIRTQRFLKSCRKNQDGAVALEFALVGLPFFLLLFAILEISLVFMAEVNITHATADSARKVRTLQANINTVDLFKADVCSQVIFIPNCLSKLQVEVKVYNDFASINNDDPLDGNGDLRNDFVFNQGLPGSVITVRTFVEWELFANLPDIGLGNMSNGNRLVQGFAAFRNEG